MASGFDSIAKSGEIIGMWPREVKVHQILFPYFQECLILSDLTQNGFSKACFPLELDSVLLAIEWLARDEVPFAGKSYKNLFLDLTILGSVDDTSVQAEYASRLENLFSSQAYADICKTTFGPRNRFFCTTCHGRPTVANIMEWRASQEEAPLESILTNYTETRLCQPAIDIAILLYTSTQKSLRKGHLTTILKSYHKELEDNLLGLGFELDTYPYAQLVEDYQDAVVPAVGVAVNILPGLLGTGEDIDELDAVPAIGVDRSVGRLIMEMAEELKELGKI